MEFMDTILTRQSCRDYAPEQIDQRQLGEILRAGCAAPIGRKKFETVQLTVIQDPALLEQLRAYVESQGMELFEISAAAHMGTRELMKRAAQELQSLPPVVVYEPTYVERPPEVDTSGEVEIQQFDDTWVVEAPWLQRLMANVNFGDYESRNWFDQKLRQSGLFDKLEQMGIHDGDIVSMYDLEFEYQR